MRSRPVLSAASAAILLCALGARVLFFRESALPVEAAHAGIARPGATAGRYPYSGTEFTRFVADSYAATGGKDPAEFYRWMEAAYRRCRNRYPGQEALALEPLLAWKKTELSGTADPRRRTEAAVEWCAWLHRLVKEVIPRYSLDRGFEFSNVVRNGERQCFLQSVLIAGILQASGLEAGVVMVSRTPHGAETNNGHAATLATLPDGTHLVVDGSLRRPFALHQGLFVRLDGGERYLAPVYRSGSPFITGYKPVGGGAALRPDRIRTLDTEFLRSQFAFYRGERAPGGLMAKKPEPAGLERSAEHLRAAVRLCPRNPLAVYTLGRVCLKQGRKEEAGRLFQDAHSLYARAGWVPKGPRDFLALAQGGGKTAGRR